MSNQGSISSFRTIKFNHLFLVDDLDGNIPQNNMHGLGFYYMDTRFVNRYELLINDERPMTLLSSTGSGAFSMIVYTNPQSHTPSPENDTLMITVPQETLLIRRDSVMNEAWFERIHLVNYNPQTMPVKLTFTLEVDFKDIFEVRNFGVSCEGKILPQENAGHQLRFKYQEAEGRLLTTQLTFKDFVPEIVSLTPDSVTFTIETMLAPKEEKEFNLEILPIHSWKPPQEVPGNYATASSGVYRAHELWDQNTAQFISDNDDFNEVLSRCHQDIRMLTTTMRNDENDTISFLAAGIPWYVALFGRDTLITAKSCMIFKPELAKPILTVLAHYQGKKDDDWRDEQPGKILHEMRVGELARQGKIPHTPYYGSVDATALWIMLLFDYVRWTSDYDLLEQLWPNAMAAMKWIDDNLAASPTGFLGYRTDCALGLHHQGWKDSSNSAMYEDGMLAEPPVYLAEVQGYIYSAKIKMAELSHLRGNDTLSEKLLKEAEAFKKRFNEQYFIPDMGMLALGLDSAGKPLKVVASNGGHCLESGILESEYVSKVANRLMESDMFNGWGIRTLTSKNKIYNPMSYHNGSVWPHDNALIALGFAKAGYPEYAEKILTCLFDVARLSDFKSIPELFCGFDRELDKHDPPIKYPVACSPQAWAAASIYMLLESVLNICPKWTGLKNEQALVVHKPHLPSWLNSLQVNNLRVGQARLSLKFERSDRTVRVDLLDRSGDIPLYIEL